MSDVLRAFILFTFFFFFEELYISNSGQSNPIQPQPDMMSQAAIPLLLRIFDSV